MLLKMALASRWNCVKRSRANGVANTTTRHVRLWAPSSYLYTTPDALLYVQVANGVYDHLALRAILRVSIATHWALSGSCFKIWTAARAAIIAPFGQASA